MRHDPHHVRQFDLMCGLGYGKTTLGIDITTRLASIGSNQRILFLEPDRNRMENVFLAEWIRIVPEELYDINYGKRIIGWINGARILYGHRDIRGNRATRANMYRGINVSDVLDDEAAEGFLLEQVQNIFNRIRIPSPVRVHGTLTTPQIGEYSRYIKSPHHMLFTGKTADNPYLPPNYVEEMARNMSRDQVRRELFGELVALEGRVFREARIDYTGADPDPENRWPNGNVDHHHTGFIEGQPWWLFCDLGSATGAYVVVQKSNIRPAFKGPIWVVVADFCPQADASASRAFQRLNTEFGRPAGVVAGADIGTRSTTDGLTVAAMAKQIWGNVRLYPFNEAIYTKQIMLNSLSYLIRSSSGHRRLTIARNFTALDPDSHRGVREMLVEYTYRPQEERRLNEYWPKGSDQPLSHVADALMFGAAEIMAPPTFTKRKEWAA